MAFPLLSLIGWSVIPDFFTRQLLSFLQRAHLIRVPTTPDSFRRQYALTFAVVVLSYLFYNLVESARSMPPNFYEILGVLPDVDDQALKVAFRQFAKKNHPDRRGVGPDGEQLFIMVRDVYEALKDPVVRFAYDRFGPDVLLWSKTCVTTRDYIRQGLFHSSGYHLAVGITLVFWSFVGSSSSSDPVSFWRHILYATLFFAELSLILSPSPPVAPSRAPPVLPLAGLATTYTTHTPLHTLFPHRIIHQHILFLHQLFLFLSVALSRVVPTLIAAFAPPPLSPELNQEILKTVANLTAIADRETSIAVHTLLHSIQAASPSSTSFSSQLQPHEHISSFARPRPFQLPTNISSYLASGSAPRPRDPSDPFPALIREMESLIIEANIKKEDGPLRSAWEAALRRGKRILWPPLSGLRTVDDLSEFGRRSQFRRERSVSL